MHSVKTYYIYAIISEIKMILNSIQIYLTLVSLQLGQSHRNLQKNEAPHTYTAIICSCTNSLLFSFKIPRKFVAKFKKRMLNR